MHHCTRNSILVVQAYNASYGELARIAEHNKREYCAKHGYDFISIERNWNDFRDSTWIIPTTIQQLLSSDKVDHEWIYWTDVDSLIMNISFPLDALLRNISPIVNIVASLWTYESEVTYKNLAGSIDVENTRSIWYLIHTGNFFVRNCEWSKRFFSDLCNDARFAQPHLKDVIGGDEFGITVAYLCKPSIRENFLFLPSSQFISFDYSVAGYKDHGQKAHVKPYEEGDFIIHFPRRNLNLRTKLMSHYAKLVVKETS